MKSIIFIYMSIVLFIRGYHLFIVYHVHYMFMKIERIKMPKRGMNWANSKILAIIKLYT